MKRSILIIVALVQIAFAQPFFNQGGLDVNSVENGIEFTGGKAGLGGALNRNTSIALSGNTLQFTGLPSNAAASRLLVEDGTGVLGWMDKSALQVPYSGVFVWFAGTDPNASTVFDTILTPVVNNPAYEANTDYLYVGTDGKTWRYIGSGYVEVAALDKTPFMIANTTADAGGNKNDAIYRFGRLGLGHNNPQTLLDIRTNASDTEATINLYNTSSTPSSQSRLLMRSYNHAGAITTGQSNTAKGEADGLTIGVMSSADDISFKVGDAVNGTASAYPMIIQHDGNVGVGVSLATNALHVKSANDPLRVVGLTSGSQNDSVMTVNVNGVVFQQSKASINNTDWHLTGNAGTNSSTDFIGTTDAQDLVLKANNIEKLRLLNGNSIKLGDDAQNLNFVDMGSSFGSIIRTTCIEGNTQNGITSTIAGREAGFYGTGNIFNGFSGVGSTALLYASGQALQFQQYGGTVPEQEIRFNIGNGVRKMTLTPTGVGIGTASPTAKLELTSGVPNTSGLKLTNLTSSSPVSTGQPIGVDATGNIVTVSAGSTGWGLTGNAGTNPITNYIGTSDNQDFILKRNGSQVARFRTNSILLGNNPTNNGSTSDNILIGNNINVTGFADVAMGASVLINGIAVTSVGAGSQGTSNNATAIGTNTKASGVNSTAIGANAQSTADNTVIIGGINGINGATVNTRVGIGTQTPGQMLHVLESGAKTTGNSAAFINNTSTSSTAGIGKVGLSLESTGTWNGASSTNTGLSVVVTGGVTNYAATFIGGSVGVGTTTPNSTLHVNGSQSNAVLFNSAALTLGITHSVIIHTGGAVTYTLPAANTCTGREYTIVNHGTGAITFSLNIRTDGSNTTTTLNQFGGANVYRIISDGAQWRKIN